MKNNVPIASYHEGCFAVEVGTKENQSESVLMMNFTENLVVSAVLNTVKTTLIIDIFILNLSDTKVWYILTCPVLSS